jgi:N-acetylmuramoyl-L-alanine amidase
MNQIESFSKYFRMERQGPTGTAARIGGDGARKWRLEQGLNSLFHPLHVQPLKGNIWIYDMETTSPRPRRRTRPFRAIQSVLGIGILLATLFTALPSRGLVAGNLYDRLSVILTPQSVQAELPVSQPQVRIGIVAGHSGNDSGAVCLDGNGNVTLTEADVNLKIAAIVQEQLTQKGFSVDLLREYDTRLNGYRALAIVSIHNDSCEYVNDQATGYKVAAALNTYDVNRANRLTACLVDRYQHITEMSFHAGSITADMREYHSFRDELTQALLRQLSKPASSTWTARSSQSKLTVLQQESWKVFCVLQIMKTSCRLPSPT